MQFQTYESSKCKFWWKFQDPKLKDQLDLTNKMRICGEFYGGETHIGPNNHCNYFNLIYALGEYHRCSTGTDVPIFNLNILTNNCLLLLFIILYWMFTLCSAEWREELTELCCSGALVADVPMTDCNWSSGLRAGRWLCPLWPQCARWVWPYGRSSRSSTPTFWRSTPSFDDSANKVRKSSK